MSIDADREPLAKLALDEAVRTLHHQDAEVNELRSRVMTLVSLCSAATAFAAGSAIAQTGTSPAMKTVAALATIALVLLLREVRNVLKPISEFYGQVEAKVIVEHYLDDATTSAADSYRQLALHYSDGQARNHETIKPLRAALHRSYWLAATQLGFWVLLAWLAIL